MKSSLYAAAGAGLLSSGLSTAVTAKVRDFKHPANATWCCQYSTCRQRLPAAALFKRPVMGGLNRMGTIAQGTPEELKEAGFDERTGKLHPWRRLHRAL